METHPNAAIVQALIQAYMSGDVNTLEAAMADDIVWHIGGRHPLAGDYCGRDEVVKLLGRYKGWARISIEPLDMLADDEYVVVFVREFGQRDGRELDVVRAEALRLSPEGKIREYWGLANDQAAEDAFFAA